MAALVPVMAVFGATVLKEVIGSNNVPPSVATVLIDLVDVTVIELGLPCETLSVNGTLAVGSPAKGTGINAL